MPPLSRKERLSLSEARAETRRSSDGTHEKSPSFDGLFNNSEVRCDVAFVYEIDIIALKKLIINARLNDPDG